MPAAPSIQPQLPLRHEQIKQKLEQHITRNFKPGDRLPPISELAREMGVGENNAYKAVRELCREGILASRPRQGTIVTARPGVKRTRPVLTRRIYLPLGPDRDGMIHRMARAFVDEMARRGREVTVGPAVDETHKPHPIDLTELDVDAVVLLNESFGRIQFSPRHVVSIITTSAKPPLAISRRYDVVNPDNQQGGVLVGECMRKFGITDAAFAGVRDAAGDYCRLDAMRLESFERGLGKSVPAHRRLYVDYYSQHDGAKLAQAYTKLKSRPQALFTSSDDIATGFVAGAAALNLEPRRDYLLVGFDGQSFARAAIFGGITTVAVPAEAMGRQAADFLDSRLDQPDLPPRSISLGCVMRQGATTPVPSSPEHPFWKNEPFWPAPPEQGDAK